ncbi:MAG TPA: PrsW family glutamic-type intramembrane protease [Candidatus Pacearchaeota archaeon]|nr:PrsW family glutamic-type intramembrane protease [Candidatus Pacearchaeota archaeon]HPR79710.1 PrsW family glutamic-type intramembrane protease [Candidatus Pacearchaeota archaeon]
MDNNILINLSFAILPGIIWLLFFLRKDNLPEPKKQILKVFFCGAIAAIPIALIELWLLNELSTLNLSYKAYYIIKGLFVVGLTEEIFKYVAVRYSILNSSHVDEPIDIPLYMIIGALGFATAENALFFCTQKFLILNDPLILSFTRFIGATLLHALASGTIGLFLVLAFHNLKFRHILIALGFAIAISAHAFFNFFLESSIMKETMSEMGYSSSLYALAIVYVLFLILSICLKEIKKLKGVCKI